MSAHTRREPARSGRPSESVQQNAAVTDEVTAPDLADEVLAKVGADYAKAQQVATILYDKAEARAWRHAQRVDEKPDPEPARRWLPEIRARIREVASDA